MLVGEWLGKALNENGSDEEVVSVETVVGMAVES